MSARSAGLLALVLLLGGCASAPESRQLSLFEPSAAVLWPELPQTPRFRYLGELVGERNFGLRDDRRGALRRAFDWLTGLDARHRQPLRLRRPVSGASLPDERIFVSDAGLQAVAVFDLRQRAVQLWQRAWGEQRFRAPGGVVAEAGGGLLVADAELGAVFRLDADGEPRERIGDGLLQRPTGLARDPASGRLYVADTAAHDIKVFAPSGELLDVLGGPGSAAGRFNAPTHLAFAGGDLYVTDTFNARVQRLDVGGDGEALASIGRRGLYVGDLYRPKGVAVDDEQRVYVVESYYDHLLVFDGGGRLLLPIGGAGRGPGQFFLPAGVWLDGRDRIYVADMFNARVVVIQFLGA